MHNCDQIMFAVLSSAELCHSGVFVTFCAFSAIILISFISRGLSFDIFLNTDSITQIDDVSK